MCKSIGLEFHNFLAGKINRLDIFLNLALKYSFPYYASLLSDFQVNYLKGPIPQDNSLLWKNSQQEIFFYGKTNQLEQKGVDISEMPENAARLEWRLLKRKKIRKLLGVITIEDLCYIYPEFTEIFVNYMKSAFFGTDTVKDERKIPISDEPKDFLILELHGLRSTKKRYILNWVQKFGYFNICSNFSLNDIKALFSSLNISCATTSRFLNEYKKFSKQIKLNHPVRRQLFNELKRKILLERSNSSQTLRQGE